MHVRTSELRCMARVHISEFKCMDSSHVWTILRCMDNTSDVWMNHTSVHPYIIGFTHTSECPYIGGSVHTSEDGCQGMLRWVPTWVFFRLPMRRRMATFIHSLQIEAFSGQTNKFDETGSDQFQGLRKGICFCFN